MELKRKLVDRSAVTAVVGLGYVGLPLAVEMVNAGYLVYGIDTSPEKIQLLMEGRSYVKDV